MNCRLSDSSVRGLLQARMTEWVAIVLSGVSFQPWSPALQTDSLSSEPPGKTLELWKEQ